MTTQNIEDYLTKQLFISRNIVTYRSLSREFSIHVNVAKNELAAFHAKTANSRDQVCCATYIVSGLVLDGSGKGKLKESQSSSDMDVDMGYRFTPTQTPDYGFANGSDQYGGDVVVQVRMTVVGEDKLEDTKAKYEKVTSMHVYSLSPSPIRDADLLCEPTRQIREIDNRKGIEMAKAVGRIIGADIQMLEGGIKAKTKTAATTSAQPSVPKLKAGPSISAAAVTKSEDKGKESVKEESKKPKPTGKLNFFAPKAPKEKGKEILSKDPVEPNRKMFFGAASKSLASTGKVKEATPTSIVPPRKEPKKVEPTKRGTKRKPIAGGLSDEQDEETKSNSAAPSGPPSRFSSKPPSTRSSPQPAKLSSKPRIIQSSDDEDDNEPPMKKSRRLPRRKAIPGSDDESGHDSKATSEAREALKSMMDLDDDKVERVARRAKVGASEETVETELEQEVPEDVKKDEDVEMSDDRAAKPKPKLRKKKKVIPVGRNGLKKRPVTKTQTVKTDDGWTVCDYTSYESCEEVEETNEPVPVKKGKRGPAKPLKEKKEMSKIAGAGGAAVDATASGEDGKSNTTIKMSTSQPAARTKGGQKQKTLGTFFAPQRPKK